MRPHLPFLKIVTVALAALTLAACQTVNQATGERQLSFVSPEQEAKIGAQEHPKMLAKFGGAFNDPNLQAYVTRIGNDLAAVSEMPDIKWTFTLLDSPVINAFALPGGYVYVSRGLMALANSEDELAGVIGHEIGHVTARHGATRITRGQLAGLGQVLAGVLTGSREATQMAGFAGKAYVASYSRDQEHEADELGVRYLYRGGYDAFAASRFLSSLAANTALMAKLDGRDGAASQFDFFATHPNTPERVQRAYASAAQVHGHSHNDSNHNHDGDALAKGRGASNAYLAKLDGMIFGENPAQGIVDGQTFTHPDLNFRFVMPGGISIINTPTAVRGQSQTRIVIFDGDRINADTNLADYISRGWLAPRKIQAQSIYTRRVNGMRAATAEGAVNLNGKPGYGFFAVIRHSANRAYRIAVLEMGAGSRAGYRDFESLLQSFRKLTSKDRANLRVKRLKIVTVRRGDTPASLAKRMAVDTAKLEQFQVLNGLIPGESLKPGTRVKLVVESKL